MSSELQPGHEQRAYKRRASDNAKTAASELKLNYKQGIDCVKVFISGEIDIFTTQRLREELYNIADTSKKDLWLECSQLNYIDSTGIGIFVGTLKRVKQYGGNIVVANLKDNIKKLFLITGLDKILTIE
jgi:anti-sigma B factor antagonist